MDVAAAAVIASYRVVQKIWHHFFLYALTLPNINRFPKLFHCQNQEKICNNTIAKDPRCDSYFRQ